MKTLWCCYCKRDVPMLDDAEFALVWGKHNVPPGMDGRQAVLAEYNRLTGSSETNWHVVFHHQISRHGPPCPRCGKVLRTPVAYKCFECGHQVHLPNWSFLFTVNEFFQIKGRGLVLIADRDALIGKSGAGSKIDIRSGSAVVLRTTIHAIEEFLGTPSSSRKVSVLLSPDASHERIKIGHEVWVTEPPKDVL
jgi:hypothetical protein